MGEIDVDELRAYFESEDIATYFSALDLNVMQVKTLFSLMDVDGNNVIDQDEFIWGCLRLKGNAKSLDVATLHLEVQNVGNLVGLLADAVFEHVVDVDSDASEFSDSSGDAIHDID